jgi:glycolate oxidase
MFSDDDLMVMQQARDAIDPRATVQPGQGAATPRLCGEVPGPYRQHPVEAAGLADRF